MKELYQMTKEELFLHISAKESGFSENNIRSENNGLSKNEVKIQRKRFGKNRFEGDKKRSIVFMQWNYFYLIFFSIMAIVLGMLKEWKDCFILLGVVLISGIIKIIQAIKLRKFLEKRKNTLSYHTKVIRDGLIQSCSSDEIVVGDIILLEAGDFIYADGRILEHKKIIVDESALTGERTIIEKKQGCILERVTDTKRQINMVFAGSCVIEGEAKVLVTAVGAKTQISNQLEDFYKNQALLEMPAIESILVEAESNAIMESTSKSTSKSTMKTTSRSAVKTRSKSIIKSKKTPFQIKINRFYKWWVSLVLAVTILLCFICFIRGDSDTNIILYVTAFIIACIPEAIYFMITRMLSVGIKRLEQKKIVIQDPAAVEILNQVSVICFNEIGLLTQEKKEVKQTIIECKKLGIQPIIITEEERKKAIKIAKQMELLKDETQIIEGSVIDELTDSELDEIVEHILIYVNVSLKNKIRVVKAWQRKKMVVAITEGNLLDLKVLNQADICIGIGLIGRKITKKILPVMVDKNLTTTIKAITESRIICSKIQNIYSLFISSNIAGGICILLSFSFALPIPFMPMQLLCMNIVIDIFISVLIGFQSYYKKGIQEKNHSKMVSILTRKNIQEIVLKGMSVAILIMVIYGISSCLMGGYIARIIALVLFGFSKVIYAIVIS